MITLNTNLKNMGTTQLTGFDFNSYCKFGDVSLACGQDGLSKIGVDGASASLIETFVDDFEWPAKKKNRFLYFGIETAGTLIITPIIDKVDGTPIIFTPNSTGRQFMRMPVVRVDRGFYWAYRIENVDGCWFSIDELTVLPIYLSKRSQ